MHIVLVEPEIPQNAGNIARTASATGATLHLVKPLGFEIDDAKLKRAGLDYWHTLDIHYHESLEELQKAFPEGEYYYLTTKGKKTYSDFSFGANTFLVFGKETKGLPEPLLKANSERCLRIPMKEGARSLNLSNAVAIIAFEVLRQQGFVGLK